MTPELRANEILRKRWIAAFHQGANDKTLADAIVEAIAAAVAEERERCAKVADEKARYYVHLSAVTSAFREIAAAIRGGEA